MKHCNVRIIGPKDLAEQIQTTVERFYENKKKTTMYPHHREGEVRIYIREIIQQVSFKEVTL